MKKVIKCKLDPHKMGREIYDLHMDLQEEIWRCAKDLLEETQEDPFYEGEKKPLARLNVTFTGNSVFNKAELRGFKSLKDLLAAIRRLGFKAQLCQSEWLGDESTDINIW